MPPLPPPSSSQSQTGNLSLAALPQELHLYLLDFLDWPSTTNLRLTCSNFANLFSSTSLQRHHTQCALLLYAEELAVERQLQTEYWEAAEQSFLGYHSSSYTSSSLDPDLRAYTERYSCIYPTLPCYHCLRWLPSVTDEAHFASQSAFSRGRSTRSFNLGGRDARKRICITCAIRTGMYPRGSKVKHNVVCKRCGMLGEPAEHLTWRWSDPRKTWKVGVYCRSCCEHEDVVDLTIGVFMHEQRWKKYEDGMARGRFYREEKGKKLREERDVVAVSSGDKRREGEDGEKSNIPSAAMPMKGQRYCITVKSMRYCKCHPERGFDPLDDPTLPNL